MRNRVYLSPLTGDLVSDTYLSWMNDPEVIKYTESRWKNYTKEDLISFVEGIHESSTDYLFGIYIKGSNKHIGNIKIGNINMHHKFADLGIIIGAKEEWGKGYAAEAIQLALHYAFSELDLFKVTAGVYSNNIGSIKTLKKAGFKESGLYRHHCLFEDRRIDVIMMEIINKGIT